MRSLTSARPAPLVLALLLAAAAPVGAQERPPAPVTVRAVATETVAQRERVLGSVRAASEAVLAALEEGAVLTFDLREGTAVRRGEALVVLDPRRLAASRAALAAARAEAEATQAQRAAELRDAEADLAALAAASQRDAIAERELRRARTAALVAEAQAAAAAQRLVALAAELELLDLRLADMTLRAPFDGVIVERHVEVGEWVKVGDPLVTLVSTGALEVWLDVPERLFGVVTAERLGATLGVAVGAGNAPFEAQLPRVVPRIDPRSRTFPLVSALPPGTAVSAGASASAWLDVGTPVEAVLVPKDALVYRPGGVAVMLVVGEGGTEGAPLKGTAALVPVVIRFERERDVAIQPGALPPGAWVVTEGNERLFPGTPVLATVDRSPLGR